MSDKAMMYSLNRGSINRAVMAAFAVAVRTVGFRHTGSSSNGRREVACDFDFVPVGRRTAHEKTDLVMAAILQVCFTHSFIKPAIDRRDRRYGRNHIAPGFLHLIERDILAGDVAIHGLLIQRVAELYDDVVHACFGDCRITGPTVTSPKPWPTPWPPVST
jgi:hypothetical protein